MTKKTKSRMPRVLVYDIETTPVLAWIWRCGEQVVNHGQLHSEVNTTKIICITYRWLHESKAKALIFNLKTLDDSEIVKQFDVLVKQADVIIGKNNNRFDNKHINFRRMIHGLPAIPDWTTMSDDLEVQMRRHFNMQSYSLDYFSKLMGQSGKIKMELQDWIDIVQFKNKKKLKKMVTYGKKDADDTAELILKVWPYVTPKFNYATHLDTACCITCGHSGITKDRIKTQSSGQVQTFWCPKHKGYAGQAYIKKDGTYGKLRR